MQCSGLKLDEPCYVHSHLNNELKIRIVLGFKSYLKEDGGPVGEPERELLVTEPLFLVPAPVGVVQQEAVGRGRVGGVADGLGVVVEGLAQLVLLVDLVAEVAQALRLAAVLAAEVELAPPVGRVVLPSAVCGGIAGVVVIACKLIIGRIVH